MLILAFYISNRDEFEREAALVADHNARLRDTVELSIGGERLFTVARNTLTQFDGSMLAAMFSGRHQLATDSSGRVFLDRDPKYFTYVLNYLRNGGKLPAYLPADEDEQQRVRAEFDYFMLPFTARTASLAQRVAEGAYSTQSLTSLHGSLLRSVEECVMSDDFIAYACDF